MEPIWVAFGCGTFIGFVMGAIIMSLCSIRRVNEMEDIIYDLQNKNFELSKLSKI